MRKQSMIAAAVFASLGAGAYFAWQAYLSPVAKAKEVVLASLNDPDSAIFGEVAYRKHSQSACGDVNAKNRMGGYVGPRMFIVDKDKRVHFAPSSDSKSGSTDQRIKALEEQMAFLELAAVCDTEAES